MKQILSFSYLVIASSFCLCSEPPPLVKSRLLVGAQSLKQDLPQNYKIQRRLSTPFDIQTNRVEITQDPELVKVSGSISSTFEAASDGSIPTTKSLENANLFTNELGTEPTTFSEAIQYIARNKEGDDSWDLSDGVFLSSFKSIFKNYVSNSEDDQAATEAAKVIFSDILPNIAEWGGNGPNWIKRLSQASIEGLSELGRPQEEILATTEALTNSLVDFINSSSDIEVPGMLNRIETVDANRKDPNTDMQFGGLSGFDPENFAAYQQLAVGLAQGFYNSQLSAQVISEGLNDPDYSPRLFKESFKEFSGYKDSIIESATNSLLSSLQELPLSEADGDHSLYAYDSLKSLANGFVIASTVYATSEPDYLAEGLYTDAAELSSRAVAHASITHPASTDRFSANRIAESVAHGAAMGAQLATVLPQSMEFVKNWEIFSQSRRDIALAVSRGSAFGAVDAAAKLVFDNPENPNYDKFVERVSQGASLGSMMGTTGLAIYYPTDQLVPIINFTAQGSAYGSVNPVNLDALSALEPTSPATEEIQVSLARQSALGSSMGAIFEPTVLLGLTPNTKAEDKQTIDNLSAASFGATYGAIQGRNDKDLVEASSGTINSKNTDKISVTEIVQSSKQGTTEGALIGAKLALGIEDATEKSLNSKGVMLKAINSTNAKAASDAVSPLASSSNSLPGSPLVGNPLRTSSKDMLLLMRKFGINPRYTNAATMFKRPVVPQLDEPPEDLVSETSPVGDSNETYAESISNASPI